MLNIIIVKKKIKNIYYLLDKGEVLLYLCIVYDIIFVCFSVFGFY